MRTAFVTGATGFIGTNLVRLLLEEGYKVRALVRNSSARSTLDALDVELISGDLRDKYSVAQGVKGADEVYHVGAHYSFWEKDPSVFYESNVGGTINVLDACLSHRPEKIVYTSTVGTIGLARAPQPCDETTPVTPGQFVTHYKRSKLEAEKAALEYVRKGLPLVVVNPSTPIGPWDSKPTPTGKILADFQAGRLPAYLDTGLNFIHVEDVAKGHLLAARKGRIGERYILGNQNMSLREFLHLLAMATGRRAPRFRIPFRLAWLVGAISTTYSNYVTKRPPAVALESVLMAKTHMYFDASKAVRELGLPQSSVAQAVTDALLWMERHGAHVRGSA